jgi:hypothetical protein
MILKDGDRPVSRPLLTTAGGTTDLAGDTTRGALTHTGIPRGQGRAQEGRRVAVDFLPPEVARLLGALDGVSERLGDVCERLAAGVDPQGNCTGGYN